MEEQPFLRARDVAKILGEEYARARAVRAGAEPAEIEAAVAAAEPLTLSTVGVLVWQTRRGKMPDNPMPLPYGEPARGSTAIWAPGPGQTVADLEQALRDWYRRRPGRGAGGGRPRKQTGARRRGSRS